MDAIILCGGKGTRLASMVSDRPKPMALVGGKPFLEYILRYLHASEAVSRVILSTGYLSQTIESHFGDRFGCLSVVYSAEKSALGTGGAVVRAVSMFGVAAPFLILNGDSFIDFDISVLHRISAESVAPMTMVLYAVENADRFGTVVCDGVKVTEFSEKRGLKEPGLINAGVYLAVPSVFDSYQGRDGDFSLERVVLQDLARSGGLAGVRSGTRFIDIGLPESYAAARNFFASELLAGHE